MPFGLHRGSLPPPEKRSRIRFPLSLNIDYRSIGPQRNSGAGQVVDISSTGVRFVGKHEFEPGIAMELTVYWPVLLEGTVPLQLRMFGTVVRALGNQTALAIDRHEFRTIKRSRSSLSG